MGVVLRHVQGFLLEKRLRNFFALLVGQKEIPAWNVVLAANLNWLFAHSNASGTDRISKVTIVIFLLRMFLISLYQLVEIEWLHLLHAFV